MPKITSTPTASRERTRLCAPVMPVAGSAAAGRAAVSTPASEAAASRVAASLPACSLGVVVIGGLLALLVLSGGVRGGCLLRQQKTPRATGTEGSARRSGTGALGDYEAAQATVDEQAGARHPHTVRPRGQGRQPTRPTVWTPPSISGSRLSSSSASAAITGSRPVRARAQRRGR